MKRCVKCVLPGTFPGIKFDKDGVCSLCGSGQPSEESSSNKEVYKKKFDELIRSETGKADYDCMVAYSGGKDSSYTLYALRKEFGLNVLAFTMDNSFVSSQALRNISSVTESLGVDSIIMKPDFSVMKNLFRRAALGGMFPRKTTERASEICTACIALVKFIFLKTALEKNVPILAWGWSPGQAPVRSSIMKMNPSFFKNAQRQLMGPVLQAGGAGMKRYFLRDDHFSMDFPYSVSPLAFMGYNEKKITEVLGGLGWKAPEDVDGNSTNCLLNSLANRLHEARHGFHPYAHEVAALVREGVMTREEGLEKLDNSGYDQTVEAAREKLGISL